ncbi:MAG: hypothetical protein QG675_371 [Patescibacteria group bacterium]|jgi:3-methyladenine DNA glycosylase AlkD|nr:hypothetical protein [Patescibacteria group bacterium]
MNHAQSIRQELTNISDKSRAIHSQRFFKTGAGEYGEGDIFVGVNVPDQRKIAKKHIDISLGELSEILHSEVHEYRLTAIFILVYKFQIANSQERGSIYNYYLQNTKHINNWDIVDSSAQYIVGEYLYEQNKDDNTMIVLTKLAQSDDVWERRIAIMSTFAFIMRGDYKPTFAIADILLQDEHDLIQKAVGWMLREVGKRVSQDKEEAYLKTRYQTMPRTMLRYAIERFEEPRRKEYLLSQV